MYHIYFFGGGGMIPSCSEFSLYFSLLYFKLNVDVGFYSYFTILSGPRWIYSDDSMKSSGILCHVINTPLI